MNKKGQMGLILLFLFIISLVWSLSYSIEKSNPYNTYMSDCSELYKTEFKYTSQCINGSLQDLFNDSLTEYSCKKTNNTELKMFCHNKWGNTLSEECALSKEGK